MRIPLATNIKTRTGNPDKDARLKNAYVEIKGEDSVVRKRPVAQGGLAVGTGTAQGGIGLNINGVPSFIGFWGDTLTNYTGGGTNWNSGTSYNVGDMVSVGFVDYWAINANTNSQPPNSNWSSVFVPPVPPLHNYATLNPLDKTVGVTLSNGNLTATYTPGVGGGVRTTINNTTGKWYWEVTITSLNPVTGNTPEIGIATSSANLATILGLDSFGWSYVYYSPPIGYSVKWHGGISTVYGSVLATGDIVGVALNLTIGTIEYFKNGVSQGMAFGGISGNIYPAVCASVTTASVILTCNFGATAFTYSPPAGFNAGFYV